MWELQHEHIICAALDQLVVLSAHIWNQSLQ